MSTKGMSDAVEQLTRAQTAARLNVSIATVRRYEARGLLHPSRGKRGKRLFGVDEVEQVRRLRSDTGSGAEQVPEPPVPESPLLPAQASRRAPAHHNPEGRIAAQAFLAFEQGADCIAVVQRLEITPAAVRDLWEEYRDLQDLDPATETQQKIEDIDVRLVALEGRINLLGETVQAVTTQMGFAWDPFGIRRH